MWNHRRRKFSLRGFSPDLWLQFQTVFLLRKKKMWLKQKQDENVFDCREEIDQRRRNKGQWGCWKAFWEASWQITSPPSSCPSAPLPRHTSPPPWAPPPLPVVMSSWWPPSCRRSLTLCRPRPEPQQAGPESGGASGREGGREPGTDRRDTIFVELIQKKRQ